MNSKFHNLRSQKFSQGDGRNDFEKNLKKQHIPGPGQCKALSIIDAANKKSYDIIDRFLQQKGSSFGKSPRPDIANKSGAPGPGSYRHASEFIH